MAKRISFFHIPPHPLLRHVVNFEGQPSIPNPKLGFCPNWRNLPPPQKKNQHKALMFILHFRLFKATFFLRMGKDFPPIWDRFLKAEMEGSPILFASTKLAFNMYILILKMFYGKHHAAEEFGIRLSNTTEKFEK